MKYPKFMEQGEALIDARKRAQITQGEMAKKLGFTTPQSLSNMERGIAPIPVKHVKKICRITKVDPRIFFNAKFVDELREWKKRGIIKKRK